jgi:ABC-type polysaccharide/polyol phosphate transport system ATPase subunit
MTIMANTDSSLISEDGIAIRLSHVSKDFKISHNKSRLLTDKLVNILMSKSKSELLHVLEGISFEIRKGQMVGIMGRNGAGKTTLLKIIAGILKPNFGSIFVNGRLVPLLGLGVGFNENLSAIDNIVLYGMLLGLSKSEIKEKIPLVLKYAELEKFADARLQTFSTGMHARLAFATAIQVDPDILIIDEVLSVGDHFFRVKSFESIMEMRRRKKTILFVSHNLEQISKLCDSAILLHNGKIASNGEPARVIERYHEINKEQHNQAEK